METWLTIVGMAVVTLAVRALPFLASRGMSNTIVERVLRYVPPAVFAALIVPTLLLRDGMLQTGAELWAGLSGIVVAWRTKNVTLTIVAGLAVYFCLRYVGLP